MKRLSGRMTLGIAMSACCMAALAATATAVGGGGTAAPKAVTVPTSPTPKATAVPALAATPPAVIAPAGTMRRGINISGGEFAGGGAPGKLNYQYIYPTKAEIDYYYSLGFDLIRVPFTWERLQPTLYGPVSPVDRQMLRDVIDYATGKGMVVVLDMHNYARRATGPNYSKVSLVGSPEVPAAALSNAWNRIAGEYRGNSRVWLGLMNEPYGMAAGEWWPIVQQLVKDLRGWSINNYVVVPGTSWTGAHSWISSGNAAAAAAFVDPVKHSYFDVHQYLDADSSGTSADCVAGSGARVAGVIDWARVNKARLFLGEMGASGAAQCAAEYGDMLNRIEGSGVFVGWAAWGGGTWWVSNYPFRTLTTAWPDVNQVTPHMSYLLKYTGK
jgi:endoglucanase